MARGAVVIIEEARIALIRRERQGRIYFLFPGGTIEAGETPEQAAIRESAEELGVEVRLHERLATVWFQGEPQYHFRAHIIGGTFGTGTEPEMQASAASEGGSHTAVWIPLTDLTKLDVRPAHLAAAIASAHGGDIPVLECVERPSLEHRD